MQFEPISDSRIDATRNLREEAQRVRGRVQQLVSSIGGMLTNERVVVATGVVFRITDSERALAEVETPTSVGRLVLKWGADREGLMGIVVVEKRCYDEYDRQSWVPVWALNVPRWADPYVGSDPARRLHIPLDDPFGSRLEHSMAVVGLSIIAAISTDAE